MPTASTANDTNEADSINIIIVDDHPVVRRGLVSMINQEVDLHVGAEAEDFHKAIELLKEQEFDLAIVDLNLPNVGGLDLTKQIKVSHPDLPVLVLSMHDEALYAERALRAGAKGYVMKHEGSDKLITAIRAALRGEIWVSERMSSRMLSKFVGGRPETGGSPLERLSDREMEVFELLGRGQGTRDIADRLCISIKTVESHREHIKEKLGIRSANELVQHATQWAVHEGTD